MIKDTKKKGGMVKKMVPTKLKITFVIDEEEPCVYTEEGTRSEPPYDNIEIMLRRTTIDTAAKKRGEKQ